MQYKTDGKSQFLRTQIYAKKILLNPLVIRSVLLLGAAFLWFYFDEVNIKKDEILEAILTKYHASILSREKIEGHE